jgi:hypothetical protein
MEGAKRMALFSVSKPDRGDAGFSLPVAMGMGLVILMIGALLIARSMQSQAISIGRSRSSNSLAIAEAGVARTLAQLTEANNAILLTLNYDPINPKTNKTYLGPDGIANNSDEESSAVNGWANPMASAPPCSAAINSGSPNITYSGTIGSDGTYTLLAYRYNSATKTATFVVEGKQGTFASAYVAVTISIDSSTADFPGVMRIGDIYDNDTFDLQGRNILGKNGNVYYHPVLTRNTSLTGSASPSDPNRAQYFNAISTGFDNISGKIVACSFTPTFSYIAPSVATKLGDVKDGRDITNNSGGIEYYEAKKINLNDNDILEVDTTQGPVYIYVEDGITLAGNSQIRNIRSDGQPTRVGDLRLILGVKETEVFIYDTACIQTAFLYDAISDVHLMSSGDGCPSVGDTNIDGVVWAEDISDATPNTSAGIAVPDDVSSLSDLFNTPLPTKNKIGTVKSWERKQL